MEQGLWQRCKGVQYFTAMITNAWRIVEAQDALATRKLVDTLEDTYVLEELIESSKPPLTEDFLGLHRLLYTPFRYPPLQHGSRFGTRFDPSLWYGSLDRYTAMAETAYYRLNFLRASKANFGNVITDHTVFAVQIKTDRGINLTQKPFSDFAQIISSPVVYQDSQRLGTDMRHDFVESFYYVSARDPQKGLNIGVFTPKAFSRKSPQSSSFQSWQCIVTDKVADFVRSSAALAEQLSFSQDLFLYDNQLPFPAK